MKKSIQGTIIRYIALIIIFVGLILSFIYWSWTSTKQLANLTTRPVVSLPTDKSVQAKEDIIETLNLISISGKYGNWPIDEVTLSENRGNPFLPKSSL
ncbi:MAG TPA: hypothetical protein VJB67_03070 [Patescibacteria group bacterium]|nr:hypothetical protein [Patescibacteria group bacterium]